tara:strand:- start:335 stop:763 length:429 start_codon:yes stop_codon:yes gene_type:complete
VLADRATALHRGGRSHAALDDLAAGLRLGPTALELYAQRAHVLHGLHRHDQAAVDWHTVGTLHSDPWLRQRALAEKARARERAHERAHGAAHGAAAPLAAPRPHTVGFQEPTPPRSPDSSSVGSTMLRPRSPEMATRPETRC